MKTSSLEGLLIIVIHDLKNSHRNNYELNFHTFFTQKKGNISFSDLSNVRVAELELSIEISIFGENNQKSSKTNFFLLLFFVGKDQPQKSKFLESSSRLTRTF